MRRIHSMAVLFFLLAVIALSSLSCTKAPPGPPTGPQPPPTVRVSGAWALYPMMQHWAEEYQEGHSQVEVGVWAGGTGKGITDVFDGLVDIAMVSRSIQPEEEKQGGFWVPVARDAVVLIANARNPVAQALAAGGLTQQQCAALWIEGKKLTWGSLVPDPKVKDEAHAYTRSDVCGAAQIWAGYLGKVQDDLKGTGVYGDPGMVEAVKNDPLGLGFCNLSYAYDAKSGGPATGLMAVPINTGEARLPEAQNFYQTLSDARRAIAEGRYPSPLSRELILLTKGKPEGPTREFLLWILTDGQQHLDEAGYVALPEDKLKAAVEHLG